MLNIMSLSHFFFTSFSLQAVRRAALQRWRAHCAVWRTLFGFRHLRAGGELLPRTNNNEINMIFVYIYALTLSRNIHMLYTQVACTSRCRFSWKPSRGKPSPSRWGADEPRETARHFIILFNFSVWLRGATLFCI